MTPAEKLRELQARLTEQSSDMTVRWLKEELPQILEEIRHLCREAENHDVDPGETSNQERQPE